MYKESNFKPVLLTSALPAQAIPLKKLSDFADILQPPKFPPVEILAENAAQQHFKLESLKTYDDAKNEEVQAFIKDKITEIKNKLKGLRQHNVFRLIKANLRHKNPQMINFELLG